MRLGTTEIILIVVLALVLFGGGKLAGVGKALGKSIKDFKNEVKDDKAEEKSKEDKKGRKHEAEADDPCRGDGRQAPE